MGFSVFDLEPQETMTKINNNNNGETKIIRLFNKNLGSDFTKSDKTTNGKDEDIQKSSMLAASSFSRHSHLAQKAGVNQSKIYSQGGLNLNQRADRRRKIVEARKQHNIETIMALALDYCSEQSTQDDVDPDWFNRFAKLAEDISSAPMQELWGKILAGEITKPGTFSYKSLNTLKEMTNKEAIAFQHACNLASISKHDSGNIIIYGVYRKPKFYEIFSTNHAKNVNLSKFGLPYPEILTLMDIELIYRTEIESGEFSGGDKVEYNYIGKNYALTAKRDGVALSYFKFTQTGNELARLLRLSANNNYLNEVFAALEPSFIVT